MVSRTQAIKNFLAQCDSPKDLTELYNEEMECQVYVFKGDNQVLKNQEFRGVKYNAYQCKETGVIYKPFRIPYEAMTENAHYEDPPMSFDLKRYAEGIGLTGWNWKQKKSKWVGFDFDSMVNHKKGLTEEELNQIFSSVEKLDYVTIRTSTTGSGYHLYVFLEDVTTKTHTEHQMLAKAILDKMSLDCGINFQSKVDQMGQILWFWASKKTKEGLQLVKKGNTLKDVPLNWKALEKSKGKARVDLINIDELEAFNELAKKRLKAQVDEKHRRIIEELSKITDFETYWDSDKGMLVTHTLALKEVHNRLTLRGPFNTASTASSVKNCFAFPLEDGAWSVRRHGRGVTEADTWDQDTGGWTQCFYNMLPDFKTACKINKGVEDTDGSFIFEKAADAIKAAKDLEISIEVGKDKESRQARLKLHQKTDKLIVEIDGFPNDPSMDGWIKKAKTHQYMSKSSIKTVDRTETETSEEEIRHCVTIEGNDAGWFLKGNDGRWIDEPRSNVLSVLSSMGYSFKEREMEIGRLTTNYWTLINEPFKEEYPGDRKWNRNAAQLRYKPKDSTADLKYTHWMLMLNHLGRGLNEPVLENKWCAENGITTGGDYLKCWIASIIQYPKEPLPYLFFYGKENIGKSTFHEAIGMLMTKGVMRISTALESSSHFNGEVQGAVLGIIEELNLSTKRGGPTVNKIKDWVTSRKISIHPKGETPYMADNSLHFAQFSNNFEAAPVLEGDTRIVVIPVYALDQEIPRMIFDARLSEEAQDFTTELVNLEIPVSNSRLRVPVIETKAKEILADVNSSDVERFVKSDLFKTPGACVKVSDVWACFTDNYDIGNLTQIAFNKMIAQLTGSMRGKYGIAKTTHWANLSLDPSEPPSEPYVVVNGYLKKGMI